MMSRRSLIPYQVHPRTVLLWAGVLALGVATGCARGKSAPKAKGSAAAGGVSAPPPTVLIGEQARPTAAAAAAQTPASGGSALAPSGGVQPAPIVLDYGNGWYHPATGGETITAIAAQYEREPALVAQLNRVDKFARPAAGSMIYIPPTNNRERLKPILHKISRNPDLIPRVPWNKEQQAAAATTARPQEKTAATASKTRLQNKAADPWIQKKYARPEILEHEQAKATASATTGHAAGVTNPLPGTATGKAATAPSGESVQVASLNRNVGVFGQGRGLREATSALSELDGQAIAGGSTLDGGPLAQMTPKPAATAGAAARPVTAPESTATAGRARSANFQWPLQGTVVARFKEGWRKACHGIEIQASAGTPVKASRGGKVLMAEDFLNYGNLIVIDHGDGYATAYGYNREMKVRAGQQVQAGQEIATVGQPKSGASSRLFFQVRRNARPVDPLDFLK